MVICATIPWFAVLGYGCDPEGKRIREYLGFVFESVFGGPKAAVVFSGGCTDPKRFPGVSEAKMMENIFFSSSMPILTYCEEGSLTTIQNIRNLKNFWVEERYGEDSVAVLEPKPKGIFCDKDRAFKVSYIARRFFGEKIPVIGFDFQRTNKEKMKIVAGTMKDLAAVHSRYIENLFFQYRKREFGIE